MVFWRYFASKIYLCLQPHTVPSNYFYFPLSYLNEGEHIFTNNGQQDAIWIQKHIIYLRTLGVKLVVKEHRAMLGERRFLHFLFFNFSHKLSYISPFNIQYLDPIKLIQNSNGVITVNGTTGMEAFLLGLPAFIIGNPIYLQFFAACGYCQSSLSKFCSEPFLFRPQESSVESYVNCILQQNLSVDYSTFLSPSPSDVSSLFPLFERISNLIAIDLQD